MTGRLPRDARRRRLLRWSMVLLGALATQSFLLWPSLTGRTVLLPTAVLAHPALYLPPTDPRARPADMTISDPIVQYEPYRRFAAAEIRAGRLPLWNPYVFAGAPFAVWPKYGLFNLIYYLRPSASTLVFMHLAASLVATAGAYAFFRRSLGARFWPAAVGAWCYPLSGHFVLWLAFPVVAGTAWLPWLLLAADRAGRRPRGRGPLALALLAAVTLLSGLLDWSLLSLGVAFLYATWSAWRVHRRRSRSLAGAVAVGAGALAIGVMLAAPYLLPMADYVRTGARYQSRLGGLQERPPIGMRALPQVVLPGILGTNAPGLVYLVPSNRREGAPAAYAGLWMALVVAPFAFQRRPRVLLVPWLVLAFAGVSAILNVPGLVELFRVPFLNLISYNRFAFGTGFALLCLGVLGLDALARRRTGRFAPVAASFVLLAITAAWLVHHRAQLSERVDARLRQPPYATAPLSPEQRVNAERWLRAAQREAAVLIAGGLAMAAALGLGLGRRPSGRVAIGMLVVGELLWFAQREMPHGDRSLDYPRLPNVTDLAPGTSGRVLCLGGLPPNVLTPHGLRDVRGYDAVDPARYIELLDLTRDPAHDSPSPPFARALMLRPRYRSAANGAAELPGILDMLGVSHVIEMPAAVGADYRVGVNPEALPRVWVPQAVESLAGAAALARLGDPQFDPRRVAFAPDGPLRDDVRGRASVASEHAGRLEAELDMETPGLLMVAMLWDEGWRATLDGRPGAVLRANHALIGVPVDAGKARLVLTYDPSGFRRGVRWMLAGLVLWTIAARACVRRRARMM